MAIARPRTRQPEPEIDVDAAADAWREYVTTTSNAVVYETVEPWAWARLQQRLRAIRDRREARERRTA